MYASAMAAVGDGLTAFHVALLLLSSSLLPKQDRDLPLVSLKIMPRFQGCYQCQPVVAEATGIAAKTVRRKVGLFGKFTEF